MNFRSFLKKVLTNACVYFSIVTAIYSVVVMIMYLDDDRVLLDASRVLLFFFASLLFSLACGVFKINKLHGALKLIIHYLLSTFAFASCMLLPLSLDPTSTLVGIILFSVIYFICAALIALFKSRYRRRIEETGEYKSQFSK